MATGPSLSQEAIDLMYSQEGWRYIGISDCYRICPYLDFYYACDHRWWRHHYDSVMEWGSSRNGYWCTESNTAKEYGNLHVIRGSGGKDWSSDPTKINYGGNSGFQITNIAYLLGITHMVLVGFNMQVTGDDKRNPVRHFFGDHPKGMSANNSYQSFAGSFEGIKWKEKGITVINTAVPTKLYAFPKMSLEDAILQAPD